MIYGTARGGGNRSAALLGEKVGRHNGFRGTAVGLRAFCDEVSATFLRLFAYVGAITLLGIGAARIFGTPSVEAAIELPARSEWVNGEHPIPAYILTIPEFAEPEPDYAIQRHTGAGGGRRDVMTWGETEGSRLMIEIYRPGRELKRFGEPAGEITARATDLGNVSTPKPGAPIDSKFGRFSVFDFTARAEGRDRHCLGFARSFKEPALQIAGWYCKANAEVIDRGTLACAIERLSLVSAASDPKLQELFAHAELKRKFCASKTAARGPAAKRSGWIDAPKEPKLRGRLAGR